MLRLTCVVVVVVVVVVGATNASKAIPRESHCGRPFISKNFEDSSEIVSVVSQDIDCGGFN